MRKATPMKRLTSRTLLATALLGMAASGAALAQNTSGKLLATGGVSSIEGSGGGGLTTWALISGYGTDRQIGANAHLTGLHLRDFSFETLGVAVGIHDWVELSAANQSFNTKNALVPINPALRHYKLKQDVFGVKVRVAGDAVYDQDTWLPQIAVGVQFKDNKDDAVIPYLNTTLGGAGGARIKNRGTDFYVAATKVILDKSLLVSGTLRFSKANQFGLLGFGGPDGDSYRPEFEGAAALLLRKDLAVGAEVRVKRGNLKNPALNLKEQTAADLFVAWFPTKNVSVTAAYVDLGQVAGALTHNKRQAGGYLSVQAGF